MCNYLFTGATREAIQLTRNYHQGAINQGIDYFDFLKEFACPLCVGANNDCRKCTWVIAQNEACNGYRNSTRSIIRLEGWLKLTLD